MHTTRLWLHLALLTCSSTYAAPAPDVLTPGTVLIATENLNGSSFQKTVILITQHDQQGTLGVAINRPSQKNIGEFFPDFSAKVGQLPLFLGGPVRPQTLFILARGEARQGWIPVTMDIYFTGGTSAHRFLKQPQNLPQDSQSRVFAGYTGWAAGQLETEIQRGDWSPAKVDPGIIFSTQPDRIWEQLHRSPLERWI